MTYIIGLTGNIACGKSTVLALLASYGAYTIDADKVVHAQMAPGLPANKEIKDAFGPEVSEEDGSINRMVLGKIVFNDREALRRLESIILPRVRDAIITEVKSVTTAVAVIDAVKLLESPLLAMVNQVWVVACPPDQQLARLMVRNKLNEKDARLRIDTQSPQAEKIARADIVIDNGGSPEETIAQVVDAWRKLPF